MSNTQNQSAGLSQLQKLQALQSKNKAQAKISNMDKFENIVAVYLGTEPTEHFPKVYDENGNKVKDEKGNDKRSKVSDGWTYTFSEFQTCKKVKIVLSKRVDLKLLSVYSVSGMGYDIKSADMYFIEKEVLLQSFPKEYRSPSLTF
jgi:lambda repressor-like predicted transcriptional regulator